MTSLLLELEPSAVAPGTARRRARGVLAGLPAPVVDDVLLVVTELVTNAVEHGRAPVCLELVVRRGAVEVGVTDGSPRRPRALAPSTTGEGGRGIALVVAVASSWGVDPHEGGKRVWARVGTGATPA